MPAVWTRSLMASESDNPRCGRAATAVPHDLPLAIMQPPADIFHLVAFAASSASLVPVPSSNFISWMPMKSAAVSLRYAAARLQQFGLAVSTAQHPSLMCCLSLIDSVASVP